MDWITAVLLFIVFATSAFVEVKELYSIIEHKVLLSGLYCLIGWVVFSFGAYGLYESRYYIVPIISGSVLGTMLSVFFKKRNKNGNYGSE